MSSIFGIKTFHIFKGPTLFGLQILQCLPDDILLFEGSFELWCNSLVYGHRRKMSSFCLVYEGSSIRNSFGHYCQKQTHGHQLFFSISNSHYKPRLDAQCMSFEKLGT